MSEDETVRTKARAIFTNDAECDDMNSLVHLLLYVNDIDLEGIVLTSSIYHYAGDPAVGIEPYRWAGGQWMWDYLDDYERVWPNLIRHDPAYPTAEELRAVTCIGNVRTIGDMEADTEGSELIRHAIFADDPRPVWLLAGGGTNTIARALKRIEEEHAGTDSWEAVYRRVCQKAIIYMIVTQDDTYRDYISKVWPELPILHCADIRGIAFRFNEERDPAEALRVLQGSWLKPNLLDKGPLCARYHTWFDGHVYPGEIEEAQFGSNFKMRERLDQTFPDRYTMISEGDSPSFLHLIDKGLRSVEDPAWGGWGGRFVRNPEGEFGSLPSYYQNACDDDCGTVSGECYQITRWLADVMNDFACRAQWCVADRFEDANHEPRVWVDEGADIQVEPGQRITLHAHAYDPDGDELMWEWMRYHEADRYPGGVSITRTQGEASLIVPLDARPGDTIHLVVCVRDRSGEGEPYMVRYQRIVLSVVG